MERNNRPQGRQKYVSDSSKGTARRGSGLNTGPVGSAHRPGQQAQNETARPVTQRGGARSSGRRSPLAVIVILLVLLLGGGGRSLFGSLLFGGSDDYGGSYDYSYSQSSAGGGSSSGGGYSGGSAYSGGSSSGYSDFSSFFSSGQSPYSTLDQGAAAQESTDYAAVDTGVASGARAKRTEIYGKGLDNVTLMVFMCGTDLESKSAMATKDLVEMTKATLGSNVHILVYTGGCTQWNNNVVSAQYNQIYQVADGGLKCLVSNAGTGSMTSPDTLAGFIQWCAENYPANRNDLILWDHGGGSVSGFGYDQKYARSGSMTLEGINAALKQGGVSFDFIGFDACLMATTETALMLEPYADYLIASEETEPGIGWYYTNWLTKLGANTGMTTLEIGKNIVDDFVSTCASQCRGQAATLSVVDLAELAYTAPEPIKAFAQSLSKQISSGEYGAVSNARSASREFARSTAIDQIDLVDFARRLDSAEGTALCEALRGAIKYNRTSSNMTNAYGLSIYFPYRKLSNVDKAVKTYDAIGMDASYSQCIRDFASLEAGGQAASGGYASPLDALLGGTYSSSGSYSSGSSSYDDMDALFSLMESFFGGGSYGGLSGLSGSNNSFLFGRAMSTEDTVQYLTDNHFEPDGLVWTENREGDTVLMLPEEQWELVEELELNVFYDDGEGYIDLGLDNVFDFDDNGDLLAPSDRTWLAVNGQTVAYYHDSTSGAEDELVITGHIPVLLNGERSELLVLFDADNPRGIITGARRVYLDGETETVAKNLIELEEGDTLDFLCDYYAYDGSYENSYYLGDRLTVGSELELSNVDVGDGAVNLCYRFTDIYQQHYWTPAIIR